MRKNGTYNTITDWSSTIGKLRAAQARVRALCNRCGFDRYADLATIEAHNGPAYSLWNRTAPCPTSGCSGRVWFKAMLPGAGWPTNMKDGDPMEADGLHHAWLEGYDYAAWKRAGGGAFDF